MVSTVRMCHLCGYKPRQGGSIYCHNCLGSLEAEVQRRKPEVALRYVVYQGTVVGFFPNGRGSYSARLLDRNPKGLTQSKVVYLDNFVPGYTRDHVKKLKKMFKRLTERRVKVIRVKE